MGYTAGPPLKEGGEGGKKGSGRVAS